MVSTGKSTGSGVADLIRDAINSGRWSPGVALRQEDLAAEYKVSRIPIRDALSLLQGEGLVTVEPNRGAYVTSFSAAEVSEMFDLRVLLETDVLRRAIDRHTPKSCAQLEIIQKELDIEDDKSQWIARDRAFHELLYGPSQRSKSFEMIRSLRGPIERFSLDKLSPRSRRAGWSREHHAIIDAVKKGNVDKAVHTLTEHLRNTQKTVLLSLSNCAA